MTPTARWACGAGAPPPSRRTSSPLPSPPLPLLLMLALYYALPGVSSVGDYDPCAGQASVSKSDGFSLGLAFYPGGAAEAWGTLHPCPYADRAVLAARGVATMVFRTALDEMSFLRGSPKDETALMASVPGAQMMTMVAYAGNGSAVVRSQPRLIHATAASAIISGSAVGRVNSLTLIARFDQGTLEYLQWHDMGCGTCAEGDACMPVGDAHSACMGTEEACTCTGPTCLLDLTTTASLRCHLTVATAFSGTDKHSVPLTSGAQIERLGKYSATAAAGSTGATAMAQAQSLRDASGK
uniref:EGF-like domain-containing protein n=1 Tax=Mantoniella antarctica TaxID=81844 RepID=A0A7S0XG99_9CHLO|mmetsp:Transcript_4854/g.12119  ORF Transcript_4854/g.12119 Transcript_4854/m.12119 type:complete len:297 (+) Transcript_4854:133-1023(+)|eukprot:CAMPEP_0181359528 /NCGR_PEP_ID=MMETSP1106-20121128/6140_1 /TAXON_ID=81844 /ORGANISM="Mantoniella antarctica, Strain SL-175" /LENGTH=296 /DNA_ID=CAMNT_0023472659 /DNA_START=133 /DNA_END=1023 /DNA_ORIENTATION=-